MYGLIIPLCFAVALPTCLLVSNSASALASSAAASRVSKDWGAAVPTQILPPLALPPPPVIVPDSLIISPCSELNLVRWLI